MREPAAPAARTGRCRRGPGGLDPRRSDDDLIAYVLIQTQALSTGRTLRDAALRDLDAAELITFWADPLTEQETT